MESPGLAGAGLQDERPKYPRLVLSSDAGWQLSSGWQQTARVSPSPAETPLKSSTYRVLRITIKQESENTGLLPTIPGLQNSHLLSTEQNYCQFIETTMMSCLLIIELDKDLFSQQIKYEWE